MRVQITPEPTPEQREALIRALAALDGSRDEESAWWQAGIREAAGDESEDDF
jgi:hypothetical protein